MYNRMKPQTNTVKEQLKSDENSASSNMKALPTKPMGRPLLICEEAGHQVQEFVRFLRDSRLAVDISVVIASREGVLASIDTNLLKTSPLTKDWAKSVLT